MVRLLPSNLAEREREVAKLTRNLNRAMSRHLNEQERGRTDGSVQQTRRMYYASKAAQRANWALATAIRELDYQRSLYRAAGVEE